MAKLTTEQWIEKAKIKFGDKFNYSKVKYIDCLTPVTIICPEHGEFNMQPRKHLESKYGCPKCAIRKKTKSLDKFIEDAKRIHGDKYDYSKVNYINSNTKVIIICPKHGSFEQLPLNHLRGQGCPKCSKLSQREWISKAQNKFPNLDFSNTKYLGKMQNVTVKCPIHGDFTTKANTLMNSKYGCKYCGKEHQSNAIKLSQEIILKRLKTAYGNKYLYNKVIYKGIKIPIILTCKQHGDFSIQPQCIGISYCPKCNCSCGEQKIQNYLKNNNIIYDFQYKVINNNFSKQYFLIDFYLPNYNLFIEYNGIQHYIPVEHFGGKLQFEKQQKRDEELRDYCKENNINLLEIRYDENIEEKLDEYFRKQELIK